jgi:hypothetical protein
MMIWFERRGDLFSGYYIGVDEKTLLNVPLPDLSSKKYQKDLEALSGLVQAVLDMNSSNETKRAEIIASINSISYKLLTS